MPARILLVEDDAALVTLLDYNLKAVGYEVVVATTAEDGEQLLAGSGFDLVILDWMLPEMSGIELCARLRRAGRHPGLPILMLTARDDETDRRGDLKSESNADAVEKTMERKRPGAKSPSVPACPTSVFG